MTSKQDDSMFSQTLTTLLLADSFQLTLLGSELVLTGIDELKEAQPGDLALCLTRAHLKDALKSQASAIICDPRFQSTLQKEGWGSLQKVLLLAPADVPHRTLLTKILRFVYPFFQAPKKMGEIHPSASIDASAMIDPSASIGPFVVIEEGVIVEAEAQIEAYVYLGKNTRVGRGSIVRVRASLLEDCSVAENVIVGPSAVLGAQGFGLDQQGLLPHLGHVDIGANTSIGALTCVDRATLGVTRIGEGTQIDNLVQVGHNVHIGKGVILCAQVGLAGGVILEDRVTLAGQVGVNNRVSIAQDSLVAAQSGVTKDLKVTGRYSGYPAEPNMARLRRELKLRQLVQHASSVSRIHPSVWIDPSAEISEGVEIAQGVWIGERVCVGRGAVIGAWSRIERDCQLAPYAIIGTKVQLQAACSVSSFAVVGAEPQIKNGAHLEQTEPEDHASITFELVCGSGSQFREGCTISRGSSYLGEGVTRIGADCLFMAYSHVGHDAQLGARCVLANQVSLAGHVVIGDGVNFGGHAAVHQFVAIGTLAFIAANAMVNRDVPPYCLAAGDHATLRGLNGIGLKRAGISEKARTQLKLAYHERLRGHTVSGGLKTLEPTAYEPELRVLLDFIQRSQRGLCRAKKL